MLASRAVAQPLPKLVQATDPVKETNMNSRRDFFRFAGIAGGAVAAASVSRVAMAALNAEQQFWLADAALQASLIGKPTSAGVSGSGAAAAEAGAGH